MDTITSNSTSAQTKWLNDVRMGYLRGNLLAPFMGKGNSVAIKVTDVEGKVGTTQNVHFVRRPPTSARISGNTQAKGNEYPYAQTTDNITLRLERFPLGMENVAESEQRTVVQVRETMNDLIKPWMEETLFEDVMTALLNTSSGRARTRYLYGSADSNWNATHATAMANVDSTDDKMSLDVLDQAVRKAKLEGDFKITPAKIGNANNALVEGWIGFLHSYAIRDLKRDPNFKNHVLYNKSFEVMNGAFYVGTFEGLAIYEIPYSGMIASGAGANGIDVAHNLILGAGAAMVGYAPVANAKAQMSTGDSRLKIVREDDDYGNDLGICASELRGQVKLKFTNPGGSNSEDFGVVHMFTSGTADA